ncbi:MAG: glycosyltransferase family 2 protein [Selenomonadaceae bacterium]|nr:glycosyltransferase family 2 protein [Selenomonadaceae bacterium]
MDKITIVVPCYNEQEVIDLFYPAVQECVTKIDNCKFNYIFVNDGSRDGTLEKLRALSAAHDDVTYISLSRNFGKEAAMMAGIDYSDADAVIIMDADLQHPPTSIPEMVRWWREGYDDVCGKRFNRTDETFIKRTCTNFFYYVMKKFSTSYEMQRDVGDFRLLDRRCIEALKLMRENQRFTKGLFTWIGYNKKEFFFRVHKRAAGKTTWNFLALFNLAMKGMTSFTTAPLRIMTFFGMTISAAAMAYMIFTLVMACMFGDPVAGYPTLLTVMLFLGGTQLLSLGIIGEYLGQIFHESKRRPIYLVDEMNGKPMIYRPICVVDDTNNNKLVYAPRRVPTERSATTREDVPYT